MSDMKEEQLQESGLVDTSAEDVIPESQMDELDAEESTSALVEPVAAEAKEEDVIPESQMDELDAEESTSALVEPVTAEAKEEDVIPESQMDELDAEESTSALVESVSAEAKEEDVIPESQFEGIDTEDQLGEPKTAAAREEGGEDLQFQDVDDTEPVLPLSELQSSCDTYMSQQNHMNIQRVDRCLIITSKHDSQEALDVQEDEQQEVVEDSDKSSETSAINSSMEVEANDSAHNISLPALRFREECSESPVKAEDISQIDFQESEEPDDTSSAGEQEMKKRKGRSNYSSPSPKKFKPDVPLVVTSEGKSASEKKNTPQEKNTSEEKSTLEEKSLTEVTDEGSKSKLEDAHIIDISSTPEKTIIINDSQEFSLRIDNENSPSEVSTEKMTVSQESDSWKSHIKEKTASPVPSSQSQKSGSSWGSHNNNGDQNFSWSSHNDVEDKYATRKTKPTNENLRKQILDLEKTIGDLKKQNDEQSKELARLKSDLKSSITNKSSHAGGEGKTRTVTDERLTYSQILWTIDDKTNKVLSAEQKQVSFVEEQHGEKPGRCSLTSSVSTKTSSSGGSVGLPGPFLLPGYTHRTRLSVMSSVSTSTSGSNTTKAGWDGPFLKPAVPGGKTAVVVTCGLCGAAFPPVERMSSPVVNGSPKLSDGEELEVESTSSKQTKKESLSSGTLEEETSSSSLSGAQPQPQAASTPTPSKGRGRGRKPGSVQKTPKNGAAKPAKTKISLPVTPISSKPNPKGEAVLARWGRDRCYYPGWVARASSPAPQVLVEFCDGQSKLTPVSRVVKADIVSPGTLVLTTTASGEYEEALVIQVDKSGPEPKFHVERDSVTRDVEFANIALLESQVSELVTTAGASLNFNDLSLDNIISHPRKRAARKNFAEMARGSPAKKRKKQTTPEPSTSHGQTFSGPEDYYVDTDSSTHSSCSLDLRGKEVKPLDVEFSPPEVEEPSRLKLSHYRRDITTKSKDRKGEPGHIVKLMGPIPEPGSELFKGYVFLVTYTNQVELKFISEGYSSEEEATPVMWKKRLRTQIKNGGGKVYTALSQVSKDELDKTYLVTNKPSNTPLYLQCLVNNIPIYSVAVVKQCCTQNLSWKEAISQRGNKKLPAGYSLTKKCWVNPRNAQPLRGKAILLALSGDASLSVFWENLIEKSGGMCETYRGGYLTKDTYNIVVTDPGCDQGLVVQACEQKLPLVSMVWLQQCIVTGEYRSTTEHPSYKYNSGNGQDSPEY